jgi:2,4'-dihydroxyacetophenone dioxygenase
MTASSKAPTPFAFDDRNIQWQPLGELQHFVAKIYRVDEAAKAVDFIVKFDPLETIVPHRHVAPTNTFVVQGEHRLYELDGSPKEIRPCGTFTATPAGTPGHLECGGEEGAIVLYHMWTEDGSEDLFEIQDNDGKVIGTLGFKDFVAAKAAAEAA